MNVTTGRLLVPFVLLASILTGCVQAAPAQKPALSAPEPTPKAATPTPRPPRKGILVASFGTTYPETAEKCIFACEKAIAAAFPEYEVRRAYTSQMVIKKLADRDGVKVDDVAQALARFKTDGFTEVIVQPLHIIPGIEYDEVLAAVSKFGESSFEKVIVGKPLLYHAEDFLQVAAALKSQLPAKRANAGVLLMGHGTHHFANAAYPAFRQALVDSDMSHVMVATVEGYPTIEHAMRELKKARITSVTLMPFMLVAGDHAQNDMAGDEDDSWKNTLKREGYTVNTELRGLGENPAIRAIYVDRVKQAIEESKGTK